MIGSQLGSYRILEEIGKGGMATVYRAHQESINRDVAIKLIRKNISDTPDAVQRFQREAQLIARLEHPHILPVYDFDGRHEPPYIVMRFLEGGTLKEVMAQGQLPLHEVAYLMSQVCSAVDYAHRQRIIHRDLKPSNVLVDREGNAFVMDFGIARMASGEIGKAITEAGAIIGTPDYMSPEQAMGAPDVDHRTDVYALGIMLFEMLTGQLPYEHSTSMGVLMMHIQDPIPAVSMFNSQLPAGVDELISKALAKDRADRYESAAVLSTALMDLVGSAGTQMPKRLQEAAGTSIIRRIGGEKQDSTGSSTGASEQNKTVTALYASAREYLLLLEENASSEAARRAIQALMKEYTGVIREYGGGVFAQTETEILGLWGAENARENDAEQAVRAALALQEKLRVLGAAFLGDDGDDEDEPLPLNIGINSGMALLKPSEDKTTYSASGATIGIANRLMENALGIILITHDTFRQVMGIFDMAEDIAVKIRGRKDPLQTYRVNAAKARALHLYLRGIEGIETRMVGRRAELELLQSGYLNAFEDEETQVFTVISEPGIGKSRLLYEFDKWGELRQEQYRIFRGRATSAMRDRAYALVRDVVSFRFDIQDSDAISVVQDKLEKGIVELLQRKDTEMAHMIGYLCGFDLSHSPHIKGLLGDAPQIVRRARQLFIRLFTQLVEIEPVMVTLEDIHHADDASLDLFNELFITDENLRLLIVCNARPSLLDRRPSWGSGQEFHRKITLDRLEKRDSRDLARELLQKVADVPRELRDLLVDRSEGNPFYMEELVKMLIDERVIQVVGADTWQVEVERLGALHVPKTLNGLLESRLDTLLYPEKLTLQRAAVVGRIFYDTALKQIDSADEYHVSSLESALEKLAERQFIYKRESSAFEGAAEYIFASNMLRDAIEHALLERQIEVYNRVAAEWLIETAGSRQAEYIGLIADYFERAGDRARASKYLYEAGKSSRELGAFREALTAFTRAFSLLPDEVSLPRAATILQLGAVQHALGDSDLASQNTEKGLELAQALGSTELLALAYLMLSSIYERKGEYEKTWEFLQRAMTLDITDIDVRLDVLSRYAFHLNVFRLDYVEGERSAQTALALAREQGTSIQIANALNGLAINYLSQPDLLPEAKSILTEAITIARTSNNKNMIAVLSGNLGEAARMQGEYARARDHYLAGLEIAREIGRIDSIITALLNLGVTALAMHNAAETRTFALEAITLAININAAGRLLWAVGELGGVKVLEGDIAGGLAILGMVHTHPVADPDMRRDLDTVFTLLPPEMTQAEIDAAMAKGADLTLETLIEEFIASK